MKVTEQEVLVEMARRLERQKKITCVEYPTEVNPRLEYESGPYAVRFKFDKDGVVVESTTAV